MGVDVSLSGELVGVQPHVGIGDVTLQASPSIMFVNVARGQCAAVCVPNGPTFAIGGTDD